LISVANAITFILPDNAFISMSAVLQLETIKPVQKSDEKPAVEVFSLTNVNLITQRSNPD